MARQRLFSAADVYAIVTEAVRDEKQHRPVRSILAIVEHLQAVGWQSTLSQGEPVELREPPKVHTVEGIGAEYLLWTRETILALADRVAALEAAQ